MKKTRDDGRTRAQLAELPDSTLINLQEAAIFACVLVPTVEGWLRGGHIRKWKAGPGEKSRTVVRLGDLRGFIREA
jgi:hypothetical protein